MGAAPLYRTLEAGDIALATRVYEAAGRAVDQLEWQDLAEHVVKGSKQVVIAQTATGTPLGYAMLNFQPQYKPFQRLDIPEIQDLLVIPDARRAGIGTGLILFCEDLARHRGANHIGISFGLDASYGAAQRLYVRLGYLPDGNGVVYNRIPVPVGSLRPLDDLYCLMLLKDLEGK